MPADSRIAVVSDGTTPNGSECKAQWTIGTLDAVSAVAHSRIAIGFKAMFFIYCVRRLQCSVSQRH